MRLDLGYDGTDFAGWAAQPGLRTVEGTLGAALAMVLRLGDRPRRGEGRGLAEGTGLAEGAGLGAGTGLVEGAGLNEASASARPLRLVVAGRTDAGVHARGQVCHVDVPEPAWLALPGRGDLPPAAVLLRRLAGVLPTDIGVRGAALAPPGFDARFSALRRRYAYRVCDDPAGVPPLRRRDVLSRPGRREPGRTGPGRTEGCLDVDAMDDAARRLEGLHDFAAFCRRRQGATTIRTLLRYRWRRPAEAFAHDVAVGEEFVVADVVADAFCHSMVRALVGAVLPVGEGRRQVGWPLEVLTGGVRDPGVTVVPPHGLVLEEVVYPADDALVERAARARAVRLIADN